MKKSEAVQKIVAWAKKQVGYRPSVGKINKYAEYLDSVKDFYNTPKNGADWCDVFVDCGFVQTFGVDIGRKMLYQPLKSTGAGVYYSAGFFKANKAFVSVPEVGDQIFYGVNAGDHTGIVVAVIAGTIKTIEGNWGNAVVERTLKLSDYRIAGYGRPNWSLVADIKEEEPVTPTPAPKPEPEPEEETTYKVKAGDTLSQIAEKFGTTYQELAKLNGINPPYVIYPNQVLKVTAKEPPSSEGEKVPTEYVVQAGDTLSQIAEKFGTTVGKLAILNGITNPNLIFPGQKLKLK